MNLELSKWFERNWSLLSNAGALFGSRILISGLGFVYWWLAAQLFLPEAVGLASSIVSAMMLLGAVGAVGLDILIVGEIPRRPEQVGTLISTAVLVAGVTSCCLGIIFALCAPLLSTKLSSLAGGLEIILLFALGTAITSISLVVDQATIGLLRGGIQLGRNAIFAAAKILLLWLASIFIIKKSSLVIYLSWVMGSLASFLIITFGLMIMGIKIIYLPQLSFISELRRSVIGHYILNLAIVAPGFILPMLVTIILSAESTAYYYVAWMIAGMAFMVPQALSIVLFAIGSGHRDSLSHYLKLSMQVSFMVGVIISVLVFICADFILSFFGSSYEIEAGWALRILSMGMIPMTIKLHYVAIYRIYNRIYRTALFMAAGAVLEILMAVIGAYIGNLTGLSIGWLIAISIEALLMLPTVYHVTVGRALSQLSQFESA